MYVLIFIQSLYYDHRICKEIIRNKEEIITVKYKKYCFTNNSQIPVFPRGFSYERRTIDLCSFRADPFDVTQRRFQGGGGFGGYGVEHGQPGDGVRQSQDNKR